MSWPKGKPKNKERKPLTLPVWWPYKIECGECGSVALYNDLDAHAEGCSIRDMIADEIDPVRRLAIR